MNETVRPKIKSWPSFDYIWIAFWVGLAIGMLIALYGAKWA
jgi:uncharacterized membrane-anchored protein YhcB (DUF1043 family)